MELKKSQADILNNAERLSIPEDYKWEIPDEWIETNGLGGYASSTILGCNTRRYHGLLIAAIDSPSTRMSLVSKLDECILLEGKRIELGVNDYGDIIQPQGFKYLSSFKRELFPEWLYEADGISLQKTLAMVRGENTTLILYEVKKAVSEFTLELNPLVSARNYHALQHSDFNMFWDAAFKKDVFKTLPFDGAPEIFIAVPGAVYKHHPRWFYKFHYSVEAFRGLDCREDLFNHGTFSVNLKEGDRLGIIISTEDPGGRDAFQLYEQERKRKLSLIEDKDKRLTGQLKLAADQFIVRKQEHLKTVMAGYHWFTDWSRDTMISLTGLCLCTGRFPEAKEILRTFANSVSEGMLPNRFPDFNQPPVYNNVDGTLWYFIAVKKYLDYTGDKKFVLRELLPVLGEIVDKHFKGTRFHIHVDKDGLLFAGEEGLQLTWMDAKIGDWVVTPRSGKPVEIQALWFNALNILAQLLKMNKQTIEAAFLHASAKKAKASFNKKFWFPEGGYLYDVIDEKADLYDKKIRPNQLLAISLPFPILEDGKISAVLKLVGDKLLTPVGLRTLPVEDQDFVPEYSGSVFKRDASYHQGTVWSWLLGPYIDVLMASGKGAKEKAGNKKSAEKIIKGLIPHLNEAGIGTVSEIFNGEDPYFPRGCEAQAWGVAEILRVISEYDLKIG